VESRVEVESSAEVESLVEVDEVVIVAPGRANVVAAALAVSAGGGMMLKLTVAPHSAREVPMGQQPASVQ
jgi:hypothetical protein